VKTRVSWLGGSTGVRALPLHGERPWWGEIGDRRKRPEEGVCGLRLLLLSEVDVVATGSTSCVGTSLAAASSGAPVQRPDGESDT